MQDTDRTRDYSNEPEDSWSRLRGILKDVFAELVVTGLWPVPADLSLIV